jgi:hypothetical protein
MDRQGLPLKGFGMATAMRRIGRPAQAHRAILEAMKKD